jgi:hypothetical protein
MDLTCFFDTLLMVSGIFGGSVLVMALMIAAITWAIKPERTRLQQAAVVVALSLLVILSLTLATYADNC